MAKKVALESMLAKAPIIVPDKNEKVEPIKIEVPLEYYNNLVIQKSLITRDFHTVVDSYETLKRKVLSREIETMVSTHLLSSSSDDFLQDSLELSQKELISRFIYNFRIDEFTNTYGDFISRTEFENSLYARVIIEITKELNKRKQKVEENKEEKENKE